MGADHAAAASFLYPHASLHLRTRRTFFPGLDESGEAIKKHTDGIRKLMQDKNWKIVKDAFGVFRDNPENAGKTPDGEAYKDKAINVRKDAQAIAGKLEAALKIVKEGGEDVKQDEN